MTWTNQSRPLSLVGAAFLVALVPVSPQSRFRCPFGGGRGEVEALPIGQGPWEIFLKKNQMQRDVTEGGDAT